MWMSTNSCCCSCFRLSACAWAVDRLLPSGRCEGWKTGCRRPGRCSGTCMRKHDADRSCDDTGRLVPDLPGGDGIPGLSAHPVGCWCPDGPPPWQPPSWPAAPQSAAADPCIPGNLSALGLDSKAASAQTRLWSSVCQGAWEPPPFLLQGNSQSLAGLGPSTVFFDFGSPMSPLHAALRPAMDAAVS